MFSIRLSDELSEKLKQIADADKKTKTEIVKLAIEKYIGEYEKKLSPYTLGKDLFGKYGSGETDRSVNRKQILKDKLRDKFSH